jgi:DNA helicase-2/ATP-dependent DNA helicase PcrA
VKDLLADLNPEQRAAVVYGEGPLLVLAGAGSGKTRVLTTRIAWLVDHGVASRDILAVTFTNKAAGEMRERLGRLLAERAGGMWIGTFHSICARVLRQHASRAGLSRDFTIFDDDDQKRLVGQILKDQGISDRIPARAVLSRIDRAKNAGKDPRTIHSHDYIDDVVRRVYPLYAERLAREDAVDFNDLLLKVLDLCDDADVGPRLASRFDHVMVDEFQDTNRVQYRLVRHLASARRNLCVVGDDDQAIYGWRGAEPRNLLDFDRDHVDARIVKLERNYRSTGVILAAANAVIAKNRDRHAKALWTDREGGEPILLEECPDERAEGEFVARAVIGLISSEGRSPGDFAVLYRTHAQSRVIEEAMRSRRVAYRIVGGVSFFQRREVKDITEYLRLIANPMADSAFERVVNVPTRGIGEATVDRVRAHARACGISMLEAARSCCAGAAQQVGLGAAARRKLEAFLALIDELRALLSSGGSVGTLVAQVIERTEYAARLEIEDKVDGPDRLRNLHELVAAAAAYDDDVGTDATLSGFNERIALTAATDEKDGRGECVTLMTIHAAKGLEFPVVFLAGMEENVFPSLRGGDLDEEIEEERRLAYVACTRAKDRLILTHARTRRTYDDIRRNERSRFLDDLPPDCLAVRARRPAARPVMAPRAAPAPAYDDFSQVPADDREPVYHLDDDGGGADDPMFPRGALVRHRIFGVGEVQDGSGRGPDRKLSIRFPGHGMKTIVARYVEKV